LTSKHNIMISEVMLYSACIKHNDRGFIL